VTDPSPAIVRSEDQGALAMEFLSVLEYALLRRVRPLVYEFYGRAPSFYPQLFPPPAEDAVCHNPWNYSFMLEYFLLDAEDFFESNPKAGAKINSGIWLETIEGTGEEIPLIAKAWQIGGYQLISIQVIHEEYAERLRILRKARLELMERRKISDALNSFKKKALFDSMTKLYNKGSFMDILQEQVDKFRAYTPTMALFFIDVDHFKTVNDTLGHLAGDSVITQVADLLKSSLRKNDFPARYGGDEFAVIAPDTNTEQSHKLAEKLRGRVEAFDFNSGTLHITISVGYTIFRPGETLENFIRRADKALYDAKQLGRNMACFRDPWLLDDEELNPQAATVPEPLSPIPTKSLAPPPPRGGALYLDSDLATGEEDSDPLAEDLFRDRD
jgi:diguanylate cyclase (GGDEF)-like protein